MDGLDSLRDRPTIETNQIKDLKDPSSAIEKVAAPLIGKQESVPAALKNTVKPLEKKEKVVIAGFTVAVDRKTLDELAIDEGYGYKTANLMVLEQECAKINPKLSHAEVRVPPFLGLNDATVQEYLRGAIPDLNALWSSFLASFDQSQREQFLQNPSHSSITISPQGMQLLQVIQNKISAHFDTTSFENEKLSVWLKNNPATHLMVRSTGKEDTDESSNAGGNESVASVSPDSRSIARALGKVIGSYFGAKSITQRLSLGDVSVFTEPKPFVPVLFQVMVGEEPNNIPRSGVMFTSEYYLASQVTRIQTGLGHNEGIVNSKVEVDSYLVDKDHTIHSVIRHKKTRIKDGMEIQNDRMLQTAPALNKETILSMKTVSEHLQGLYQKPLDIEYTVKKEGSKEIIYLLQTRPLKKPETEPQPSYVDLDQVKSPFFTCNVIPDSNSKLIRVDIKEQIIFADNILMALDRFNDPKTDRNAIKAIVINSPTSPSSHPAVFLHAKGLPIFMVENKNDFAAVGKSKEWTFDVQQGIILTGRCPAEAIADGYICYPIPRELTLEIPLIAKAQLITSKETDPVKKARFEAHAQKEFAKFTSEVPRMIETLRAGQPLLPVDSIRGMLRQLATQDPTQAKLVLASLLHYFERNVANSINNAPEGRKEASLPKWIAFETLIELAKKEIIPALENHPPQSLERLYPLKFLEALIFQPASSSVVGGFSFGLAALTDKKETASLKQAEKTAPGISLSPNQYIALNFKGQIYNKEVQEKWVRYIYTLSNEEGELLVRNLLELQKFTSLPDWLNIRFPVTESPAEELRTEIENNRNILRELDKISGKLDLHEKGLDEWSDPNYAKKHSQEFMENVLNQINQMENAYPGAGWIGKIALVNVEARIIDLYDRTIKAVTGSLKFSSDEQKLIAFQELLKGYRIVLEKIAGQGKAPGYEGRGRLFGQSFDHLQAFLNYLDEERPKVLAKYSKPPKPFEIRPGFEVGPLTIGYKGAPTLGIPLPITEEEFFTIYHQNLINAVNLRKNELGLNQKILPFEIQNILGILEKSRLASELSYIGIENQKIGVTYNIALGAHSAAYKLIFDPKTPDAGFELQFSLNGTNPAQRFEQIGSIAGLLIRKGNLGNGELPVKYGSSGVSFSVKVPKDEPLPEFFNMLDNLLDMTYKSVSRYQDLKKTFEIDYTKIQPEAFSDSLHWNHAIFTELAEAGNWTLIAKLAKQTFLGLAIRRLPDYPWTLIYDRSEKYPQLQGILGNFNTIPGNRDGMQAIKSLSLEASLYLVRCLKEGGLAAQEARQTINELAQNTQVFSLSNLAKHVAALQKASEMVK